MNIYSHFQGTAEKNIQTYTHILVKFLRQVIYKIKTKYLVRFLYHAAQFETDLLAGAARGGLSAERLNGENKRSLW